MPQVTLDTLIKNLQSDRFFRMRRHPQWTDNYLLYRDTVITNRLTQRQSVNVPLMKETVRTILARIADAPDIYFEELDNDGQKELFINEYWKDAAEKNHLELLDIVDKKQQMLYGRSFWKLNILDGKLYLEVLDPQDVLVDRYTNPWDLDSGRRVTHIGIYRTLSDVKRNPLYDQKAIAELEKYFATKEGLIVAGQNAANAADKAQRQIDLGVPDATRPILGETYVELNECQIKVWHEGEKKDVVHVVVTANANQILMDKPLRDILGINEFTYVTWADDLERTDFWSDGVADIVRVPNQILNVYFSQLVENGVMRGYGMNFYDATAKEGWTPMGYSPAPFGFYPLPGDPNKVLKHIDVPELPSHLEEMNLVRQMVESATAATGIEKGDSEDVGTQTLGEIQLLANKAATRISAINKFLKQRDLDLGRKIVALINANPELLSTVTLDKKATSGKFYSKAINPKKLVGRYRCRVTQKAQKDADALQSIAKTKLIQQTFPFNVPLQKILKEKMLEYVDLTPEQKNEVMSFEDQMPSPAGIQPTPGGGATPLLNAGPSPIPQKTNAAAAA